MEIGTVKMDQMKNIAVGTRLFIYNRVAHRVVHEHMALEVFKNSVKDMKHERFEQ